MTATEDETWPAWSSIPDDQKPVWAREVGGAALDAALAAARDRGDAFEVIHGRRMDAVEAMAASRAARGLPQ
jgi:hypothetical protein